MNRQHIRRVTLLAGFVLFQIPLLHLFLSPVLPLVAASEGVLAASVLSYAILFVAAMFLGRAFCSWLCPGAAIQEAVSSYVGAYRNTGRRNLMKHLISALWLAALLATAWRAGGFERIDPSWGTEGGSVLRAHLLRFGPFALIVPAAVLAGRWASCHMFCWDRADSHLRREARPPPAWTRPSSRRGVGCLSELQRLRRPLPHEPLRQRHGVERRHDKR